MTIRKDSVNIDSVVTNEGFVRDSCILTRCGVFTYHNPDGTFIREARLPEHVFAPESLATYPAKDIILTHVTDKGGIVDSGNFRDYTIGNIVSVSRDADNIVGELLFKDTEALKNNPHLRELSLAYTRDIAYQKGVYDGEEYDCIQINIRINNLAVVSEARAGESARLNLDSKEGGNENMEKPAVETIVTEGEITKADAVCGSKDPLKKDGHKDVYGKIQELKTKYDEGGTYDAEDMRIALEVLDKVLDDKSPALDAGAGMYQETGEDAIRALIYKVEAAVEEFYKGKEHAADTKISIEPSLEDSSTEIKLDSVDERLNQLLAIREVAASIELDVSDMNVKQAKAAITKKIMPDIRLDGADINTAYVIAAATIAKRKPVGNQYDGMLRTDGSAPLSGKSTYTTAHEMYRESFYNNTPGGES